MLICLFSTSYQIAQNSQIQNLNLPFFTSIIHLFIEQMKKQTSSGLSQCRFYRPYSKNSSKQKEIIGSIYQCQQTQSQPKLHFNVWKNNLEKQTKDKLYNNNRLKQSHPYYFDLKQCETQFYTPKSAKFCYQMPENQNTRCQNYQRDPSIEKSKKDIINNPKTPKTSSNQRNSPKFNFTGLVLAGKFIKQSNQQSKEAQKQNILDFQSHQKLHKMVKTDQLRKPDPYHQNIGSKTTKFQQFQIKFKQYGVESQNPYKSQENLLTKSLYNSHRQKQSSLSTKRYKNINQKVQEEMIQSQHIQSQHIENPALKKVRPTHLFLNDLIKNPQQGFQYNQNRICFTPSTNLRKYESQKEPQSILPESPQQNLPNKFTYSASLEKELQSKHRSKSKNIPDFLANKFKKCDKYVQQNNSQRKIQKFFNKEDVMKTQIKFFNAKNNYTTYPTQRYNQTFQSTLHKKKVNVALKTLRRADFKDFSLHDKFYTPINQQKKNLLQMALQRLKKQYSLNHFQENQRSIHKDNNKIYKASQKILPIKKQSQANRMFRKLLGPNNLFENYVHDNNIIRNNKTQYQRTNPQLFASKRQGQERVNKQDNIINKKKSRRFSQPDLLEQFSYIPKRAQKLLQLTKLPIQQQKPIQKQLNQTQQTKASYKFIKQQPNIQISDFQLGQQLGRGKFGIVVQAIHKKTGCLFALKTLSKNAIKKQNVFNQIIREVKIQYFMDHPHLVKLYGIFDDSKNIYLLQQYCTDGQLYKILQAQIKFNQVDTSIIMKQICEGVKQLHRFNVIHRDIKPENIVVNFGMCKICDFGWSIQNNNQLRQTLCGTPLYFSPQLILEGSYNQKVDIWALGVMTYQLINGKVPFNIKSHQQLIKIVNNDVVYPPSMGFQAISFVKMLLQKNPVERVEINRILKHDFFNYFYTLSDSSRSKSAAKLMNKR